MLLDKLLFWILRVSHCGKFVLGLYEFVHGVCGKSILVYVNFVLWTWQNFVGMCMDILVGIDKFCGYEVLTCGKKFCWVWDVDSWRICVIMSLAM